MDHGACTNFENLYKFDGSNYTGWVDKMKFLLISLKVFYVLDPNLTPIPQDPVGDEKVSADLKKQRKEDEALCYKYIKNSLSDRLCDLYALRSNNDPRLLWKALEANFKAKEHVKNKYFIGKFLVFRMVEGTPMMKQAWDLDVIVKTLKDNSIIIPEVFHIVTLITKLPPSWKIFAERMMTDKYDNISLKDLLHQIRVEERARKRKDKQSVKNIKTPRGPSKTKQLGVKKPKKNFKKTASHCNVRGDVINAVDAAQIDDLLAHINLSI